jgi:hypothetical protein
MHARGMLASISVDGAGARPLLIAAGTVGVLVAAAIALWAHYGTAVFYEMILAGIAACF